MTKLELKYLAGYLPYGLEVKRINEILEVDGLVLRRNDYCLTTIIGWLTPDKFKPILRPLSDLTKEINGYSFEDWLKESSCPEEIDQYRKCIYERLSDGSRIKMHYLSHRIVKKMYELHFDIHGLIEQNLAIDKNTLL